MSNLESIRYARGQLKVLDQLQLPHVTHYDNVNTVADAWKCIREMKVSPSTRTLTAGAGSSCDRHCRLSFNSC